MTRFTKLLASGIGLAALVWSGPVIFSRPLPTVTVPTNVNNPAGANRSNVDWGNVDGFANGDNFTVPGSAGMYYNIDSISVWVTNLTSPTHTLTDEFTNFALYGGPAGSPASFAQLVTGPPVIAQDWYKPVTPGSACDDGVNGASYQASGGGCFPIFKLTFPVSLVLEGGTVYDFAADATPLQSCDSDPQSPTYGYGCFFLHATNAALAGNVQEGSDDLYYLFDTLDLTGGHYTIDSASDGWDKSSDINVEVTGTLIPEPATFGFVALGLSALLLGRLRRK
jgi:hypothetical protein